MTDDEIKKLAALADEATPGPWLPTIKKEVGPVSIEDDQSLGMVIPCEDAYTHADAVYIAAANPTAIKGLIERLKQAETQRDEAYRALVCLVDCDLYNPKWDDHCRVQEKARAFVEDEGK